MPTSNTKKNSLEQMAKRAYKKMKNNNRSRIEEGRLENLPESVQFHILSFLDTRKVVQISAFSKQWRSLWTSKPVLHLNSFDFRHVLDFDKFAIHVLRYRDHSTELNTLTFIRRGVSSPKILKDVLDYAFSHGVNHLELSVEVFRYSCWPLFFRTVFDSLKTLKLESQSYVRCPFISGSFKNITVLYLKRAIISNSYEAFLGFPMMEKLVLKDCYLGRIVRVQAPKLSDLTISCSCHGYVEHCELTTPNLRFFEYIGNVFPELQTHEGGLPVLDTVVIGLLRDIVKYHDNERMVDDLISLFRGVGNARSLTLSWSIVRLLGLFEGMLKELDSPFCNLKCLNMDVRHGKLDDNLFERRSIGVLEHDDDDLFERQYAYVKAYLLKRSPDAKFSIIHD